MSKLRKRRQLTADQKLRSLEDTHQGDVQIAEPCCC
jgi:hypothetical protein